MSAPKFTPQAIDRTVQLRAAGESHNSIRDHLLEEFGINVSRAGVQKALENAEGKKRREAAIKKAEIEEAQLSADAARSVAVTMAASDLPADAKLISLRLATLLGRATAAWDGMSERERTSHKTWAKCEDLAFKMLVLKLKLGGALSSDADLDAVDKALMTKLDALAAKAKKAAPAS